jgi:hypothetical protein
MARTSKLPLGAKAAFVRSNPSATAQELVKLGKKQGISLTAGHVYNIRAEAKRRRLSADVPGTEIAARAATTPRSASNQLDVQLRTLVIRIGLDRAEQVFSELKSTLSRMA